MNDLKEEIKKSVGSNHTTKNKFAEDPLWESQAWFLRTRLKFGNDYQQFWDHTQGQINDYVTNLNSEDQVKARAEVAESFTLAIRSGFDDCNKQVDSLLQQVFQVKQIENEDNSCNDEKTEPEIINLLDVEDQSVCNRKRADPPSKDDVEKVDPEPSHENKTVNSSIVAVLEESETEEEEDARAEVAAETISVLDKGVDDVPTIAPRNDRLQVATPHRSLEPEITSLVENEPLEEEPIELIELIEEKTSVQPEITSLVEEEERFEFVEETIEESSSPEVIDLTHDEEQQIEEVEMSVQEVIEIVEQIEEIGESWVGQNSRDDDEEVAPAPSHSRGLSLTQILLDTYSEETHDTPERSMWYNNTAIDMALSTIVSRDTEDEDDEEPTIPTGLSKSKDVVQSALGLSLPTTFDPAAVAPESPDDVNVGRERVDDSADRVGVESSVLSAGGSQMEPIDLTQV